MNSAKNVLAKQAEQFNREISKELSEYLCFGPLNLLDAVNSVDNNAIEDIVEVDMGVIPRTVSINRLQEYIKYYLIQDKYVLEGYPDFVQDFERLLASDDIIIKLTPALAVASLGIIFALVNLELSVLSRMVVSGHDVTVFNDTFKNVYYLIAASNQITVALKNTNYDGFPLWRNSNA